MCSLASSLTNFRGRLIADLVAGGHEVLACAPDENEEVMTALCRMGVRFQQTRMSRAGLSPLEDARTLAGYARLLMRERPDLVLAYTQKPIIYGGLAARLTGSPFVVLMSGLGYVFSAACDHRPWLRRIVATLYREAVRKARTIFVFNGDDRRCMLEHAIIAPTMPVVQIPGSGVDLQHYAYRELPDGPPTFIMIGRLMRDKGVAEFVRAAVAVRRELPDARFQLLGKVEDRNPTGISPDVVRGWTEEGIVELLPETTDVRPYLTGAHVFVLPSYYREGLPRTLLEALATGRPVITTDMPGCREPVVPGENGWLVPARDSDALADAMVRSVKCPRTLRQMSRRARQLAEERFDVADVNRMLLSAMVNHGDPVRPAAVTGRTVPAASH
nr:glycosyltransferase family 4 protein [Sphingomonas arenae]